MSTRCSKSIAVVLGAIAALSSLAPPAGAEAPRSIQGSGSTFADRFYRSVIAQLHQQHARVAVEYRAIGSGRGKAEFGEGVTDFGATDSLVKDGDGPEAGSFHYVPILAGAIVVAYHLHGVATLRLSAATAARIFQRDIVRWDDPAIRRENPGVRLPARAIGLVRRADRSGTTSNFTKYLDRASGGVWRLGAGDAVVWPSTMAQADGNRRLAEILRNNEGSIGYLDLADARAYGLATARIRNQAGRFVRAEASTVTAALAGATVADDLTFDPLDAPGNNAYPITGPTFVLLRNRYDDPSVAAAVRAFVTFALTQGQALASKAGYAPLPVALRTKALESLQYLPAAA